MATRSGKALNALSNRLHKAYINCDHLDHTYWLSVIRTIMDTSGEMMRLVRSDINDVLKEDEAHNELIHAEINFFGEYVQKCAAAMRKTKENSKSQQRRITMDFNEAVIGSLP